MINRIVLTRVEPCFLANKSGCGDISRVKKSKNETLKNSQINMCTGADTFTSSQKTENKTKTLKQNTNNNQKGNA